ncbi:DNA/RNA polymerase [Stipitochalara longipes BDJ]|nr:DNA/RNA polymerase [Stipitochalara longipes BDJ]
MTAPKPSKGHHRIIIHFDYDCFYASVFEAENPALKSVPLAVQQKQIIVTCNYEARRRGLHKLQLIHEARQIVPDVVIVLGEDLNRFRDASKELYKFLEAFTWSGKVERLGFDEVFMDVTDIVDFNQALLNPNDLTNSFFQLQKNDPTVGFAFDSTVIAGHGFPNIPQTQPPMPDTNILTDDHESLMTRLILGSHLAQHLRWSLEEQKGYTSTVGISTNKLLSKLVGNLNKPKGQTTLLPPYVAPDNGEVESNVTTFVDGHDIGKIPGIGFKMSQKIRNHVLSRPAEFDEGLIYGGIKESVTVRDVRLYPGMGPELLEKILGGPGAERGIGGKSWGLINGVDHTEVQQAKKVPTQISIEDSYIRLDTMPQVHKELRILATSLIKRLHVDLLEDDEDDYTTKRWIAHPKTVRLSTRPRPPMNSDGTRTRSFNRISRSGPLPNFVFNLKDDVDAIIEKLVQETLIPMFRKLHPYPSGWNLSLVNIGVTNMIETASEDGKGGGRDIGRMFRKQEEVLKEWKFEDRDIPPDPIPEVAIESRDAVLTDPSAGNEVSDSIMMGSEDVIPTQTSTDEPVEWDEDEDEDENREICHECGATMPAFAMAAHERFHSLES